MTSRTEAKQGRETPRLGKLPPQFKFFLNPYRDVRFTTSCPGCCGKTKQRKLPLAIHVYGWGMVMLNKTCRFCPYCDLLIAHQDEVESALAELRSQIAAHKCGEKYFIVGTVEKKAWRRGLTEPLTPDEMLAALHDFKDHLRFEPAARWVYTGGDEKRTKPR
jgi:hypothetical protein